jgi:hypothetical protein
VELARKGEEVAGDQYRRQNVHPLSHDNHLPMWLRVMRVYDPGK